MSSASEADKAEDDDADDAADGDDVSLRHGVSDASVVVVGASRRLAAMALALALARGRGLALDPGLGGILRAASDGVGKPLEIPVTAPSAAEDPSEAAPAAVAARTPRPWVPGAAWRAGPGALGEDPCVGGVPWGAHELGRGPISVDAQLAASPAPSAPGVEGSAGEGAGQGDRRPIGIAPPAATPWARPSPPSRSGPLALGSRWPAWSMAEPALPARARTCSWSLPSR